MAGKKPAKVKPTITASDVLSGLTIRKASDVVRTRMLTGIPEIDTITGGGIVHGTFFQISGSPGVGKTALACRIIATAQTAGMKCAFFDIEGSFEPAFAAAVGVDLDALTFVDGSNILEEYLEVARDFIVNQGYRLIVIDSIIAAGALQEVMDKNEKMRSLTEPTVAAVARTLATFFRTSWGLVHQTGAIIIAINQVRATGIGTPWVVEKSTGGNALLHWTKDELAVRPISASDALKWAVPDARTDTGYGVKLTLAKSKSGGIYGRPIQSQFIQMDRSDLPEQGYASALTLAYYGLRAGLVTESGRGIYELPGGDRVRGKIALWERFVSDDALRASVVSTYRERRALFEAVAESDQPDGGAPADESTATDDEVTA